MRWTPGGTSGDIEDRRGFRMRGAGIGGGGLLLLTILSFIFKQDLVSVFTGGQGAYTVPASDPAQDAAEQPKVDFISFVLDDAQNIWTRILPQATGRQYRHAKLVLFREGTESGCGFAQSATGPFYCPQDEKVYIDLSFYDELKSRFGAPGEFAEAYVLAHEIGHHVQKILGLMRRSPTYDATEANAESVRVELQADCFAGIWANSTAQRQLLEKGDVESGLQAAAAVGDDHLQRMAGRHVSPESFTHGSSRQRQEWFSRGLQSGQLRACDTSGGG